MSFFKFTPDLTDENIFVRMSVGHDNLIQDCVERIQNAIRNNATAHILFLGPRGIGKTHLVLQILYRLSSSGMITPIRLAEEEYSIFSINDLCSRILEKLGSPNHEKNAFMYCRNELDELKDSGKPVVLFIDNIQMLFEQIRDDLGKLRSIIQSDESLHIVGSSLTYSDLISSPDEPFYRYFDVRFLQGLDRKDMLKLLRKRLAFSKKEHLIKHLKDSGYVDCICLLAGGNPRIIHTLAEIIIQKDSSDFPKDILLLLDQLTPFYHAQMLAMSAEQRKIFDAIVSSDGPLSPTEIAHQIDIKPSIAVTQIRRLKKSMVVENIKFSNKRGTKYQIKDRLYRIWRQIRSEYNTEKMEALLTFAMLWYSKTKKTGKQHSLIVNDKSYRHLKKTYPKDIEKILKTNPENTDALAKQIHDLISLGKYNASVKSAKKILIMDSDYFVDIIKPFIDHKLDRELLLLVKHHKLLSKSENSNTAPLRIYIGLIFARFFHDMIERKTDGYEFYVSALSHVSDVASSEDLASGCIDGILGHVGAISVLSEVMDMLKNIFNSEKLNLLTPLVCASEYIMRNEPEVLEKLHPEMRQLVIQIIQKTSPKTSIGKQVLDSISTV